MEEQVLPPLDVFVSNDKLRDFMIDDPRPRDLESLLLLDITHSFILRKMDKAQMIAGLIETYHITKNKGLMFIYVIIDMFVGLTACHFARSTANTSESVDTTQISQALKTCEQLKWMAGHSIWNFENKYLLLLAECQYTQGEMEKAAATYEASIKSAKEHKLIHEQAVACELAGYFYKDRGDDTTAMNMFKQARKAYIEWGAIGKASLLRQNTGIEDVSSP
jgi:ATP-dependent RNA helicase DDX31/DBP7